MAKRRCVVWKFFDLVEQEKDGIKVKNASCKISVDTILTYSGRTSNLMHHLEARHPNEYCKAKSEESGDESDKPMKQTSLPVRSSVKRCSLARNKEINTAIVDFVVLDLRPIAVVDGCGFNKLLTCLEPGYTVPSKNICYEFFETAVQRHETEATRISIHTKLGNYHRYMDKQSY